MRTFLLAALVASIAIGAATVAAQSTTTVEVAVWKHARTGDLYLSTRPADGDWTTHARPVDLSQKHPTAPSWYFSPPVAIAVDLPAPARDCRDMPFARDSWGGYPSVPVGALATWTTIADAVNAPQLTHDHHVALRDAHISGGCMWSAEQRDTFSSDLTNLNPTTQSFNSSKGSRTPDQLTGIALRILDTAAERCAYATQHEAVKTAYGLTMTEAEAMTVEAWIAGC